MRCDLCVQIWGDCFSSTTQYSLVLIPLLTHGSSQGKGKKGSKQIETLPACDTKDQQVQGALYQREFRQYSKADILSTFVFGKVYQSETHCTTAKCAACE